MSNIMYRLTPTGICLEDMGFKFTSNGIGYGGHCHYGIFKSDTYVVELSFTYDDSAMTINVIFNNLIHVIDCKGLDNDDVRIKLLSKLSHLGFSLATVLLRQHKIDNLL